ncbi:MAG: zinc-ribbon domain-containing protein [Fuerstiella sp.]
MIVFGWGSGAKQLGTGFVTTCDNCNNTNPFVVVESSKKITVYWIPVAKWSKHYFYVCPICSHGFAVPTKELAQRILAAAFRNPLEPDAKLVDDLQRAMNASQ